MASVTKTSEEKGMADEDDDQEKPAQEPKGKRQGSDPLDYRAGKPQDGFFTIYKRGQGYWTRVGTIVAIAVIGAFTAYNIDIQTPTFLPGSLARARALQISAAVTAAFLAVYGLVAWRLLNKPSNVDFLIATDSEMKKVNWTSRADLIGSTKVVIIFMFLVAIFLFLVDQIFGWAMYLIHVLKVSPLG